MPTIHLKPSGATLEARKGALLRDVLQQAGVLLDYPCGGKGTCRQCRVSVDPAPDSGKGRLKENESANGIRLACQLSLEQDCTVTIPEERLSRRAWKQGLRDEDIATSIDGGSIREIELHLAEPSLEDQRADWERFSASLAEQGVQSVQPTARSMETLSAAVRQHDWKVRALCEESHFLWLSNSGGSYGLAVDLGTTTVDIALVELSTGKILGRRAHLNRQVAFGADVISRAQSFHTDRAPVRGAALGTIEEGALQLLKLARIRPSSVLKTVVVGNPIMMHILNGMDPYQLTHVPYIPVASSSIRNAPGHFGWTFQEHGYVETLPLVSAYVGADTVGMIAALDLEAEKTTTLSIDIGTNGEMVLSQAGTLVTTSTAAGPAFEGAQISCGMRALEGAIYASFISDTGELVLRTVGDAAPKGLCGTGLISVVAQLLDHGVIEATGRLVDAEEVPAGPLRGRIFNAGGEPAFALSDQHDVYISQGDIRKLQLAKGAVRTGIETLLDVTGVSADKLDAIHLAGNFGAGLDAISAMRIGLIPQVDLARVQVVGNAALRGAVLVLLSRDYWRKAQSAAAHARFVELGGKPEFQTRFMDAMLF